MGRDGWVRSRAWTWVFSSKQNTAAAAGGFTYRPTTSRSFDSKLGSVDSLKVSTFHGRIRRACHIRATVSLPIPYRAAIDLVDQHAGAVLGHRVQRVMHDRFHNI